MNRRTVIEFAIAVLFIVVGWVLRGQGTYYKDKAEYAAGMGMIGLGMFVIGISVYNMFDKKKPD